MAGEEREKLPDAPSGNGVEFGWTQPSCESCFNLRYHGREAVRLFKRTAEICVDCGKTTRDGIFVMIDPQEARFPTLKP